MARSLSNLANNPSESIHRIKCKYGHDNKKYETCRIIYKNCECFLEYTNLRIIKWNINVYVVPKIINKI